MLRRESLTEMHHAPGSAIDSRKEVLPFTFKRVFDDNATQALQASSAGVTVGTVAPPIAMLTPRAG